MADILPPIRSERGLDVWHNLPPGARSLAKGIGVGALLGLVGWLLQNFLQLRGVVDLLASRIDLGFLWLACCMICWISTATVRRRAVWRVTIMALLLIAAWGLDAWAPKPIAFAHTLATVTGLPPRQAPDQLANPSLLPITPTPIPSTPSDKSKLRPTVKDMSIPSSDQARLEINNIAAIKRTSNGQSELAFNFFYDNYGHLPSLGLVHRVMLLTSEADLTKEQLDNAQKQAQEVRATPLFDEPVTEFYPGAPPRHYFTAPDNEEGMIRAAKELEAINNGTKRIYFFVVLKYRDRSMPISTIAVSELCGWFSGTFEAWHNCGSKRIFLTKADLSK